jgi:catechol 2,3-dioxygenase-like lactoylglutathione lyase family enzyme
VLVAVQDVYYNVVDMDRAVAFYRDLLGMRVLDSNPYWTSLEFFGARIGLHGAPGADASRPLPALPHDQHGALAGATLTLRSTDLDADLAFLQGNDVRVIGRSDNPWGRLAVFLDSEGNILKLMQAAT